MEDGALPASRRGGQGSGEGEYAEVLDAGGDEETADVNVTSVPPRSDFGEEERRILIYGTETETDRGPKGEKRVSRDSRYKGGIVKLKGDVGNRRKKSEKQRGRVEDQVGRRSLLEALA